MPPLLDAVPAVPFCQIENRTGERPLELIDQIPLSPGNLSDQLKRAICSVLLNTAEGNGRRSSRERRRFFDIARASATESSAAIEAAHAMGWVSISDYQFLMDCLLQVVKILYKLP